jgi:hypothetical protein
MSRYYLAVGVIAGLISCASQVSAQSAPHQLSDEEWQFQVTPYLFASSLDGQVGVGDRTADVDASFRNILDHLHFAAMGVLDVQRNRIVAVIDTMYTDLRGQRATPGPLFSSVNPQQKLLIFTPEVGYRLVDTAVTSIDVVGGIRLWHTKTELQFQPGLLPGVDVQGSQGWVDGIGGVRLRQTLVPGVWVSGSGDVGAGGSSHTYQIVAVVGVDLHPRFALVGGYRYLSVDYDQNVLLDTAFKGPVFGLTIRF